MPVRPLIGRREELARLNQALQQATEGRGSLIWLRGEAGIGKSHLVECFAAGVYEQLEVFWGAAWEAGGQPAFWPWLEILRGARREQVERLSPPRRAALDSLLPEFADPEASSSTHELTRVGLMDAIVGLLEQMCADRPALFVVEDLHAADESSLALLGLLSHRIVTAPMLVVVTSRSMLETPRGLERAELIELGPLDREDTETLARSLGKQEPSRERLDELWERSMGHPLFVLELSRLGATSPLASALPASIRSTIEARLTELSPRSREVLEAAAVCGREASTYELVALTDLDADAVRRETASLGALDLLQVGGLEVHRFPHILTREAVYAGIEATRRADLHARAARRLEQLCDPRRAYQLAIHLGRAGSQMRPQAIAAAVNAAAIARTNHAYPEAAQALFMARRWTDPAAVDASPSYDELCLREADARMDAGQTARAQILALEVADRARGRGDLRLLARAAMTYGRRHAIATVDSTLVDLLAECLAGLPEDEGALRAALLARYASAQQPGPQPQSLIDMAKRAVAMARRSGDRPALLVALREAASTMMDIADAEDRSPINREHLDLARELEAPEDRFRACVRLVIDQVELGEPVAAKRYLDEAAALAPVEGAPARAARVSLLRAMLDAQLGRLTQARKQLDAAHIAAERISTHDVQLAVWLAELGFASATYDTQSLERARAAIGPRLDTDDSVAIVGRLLLAGVEARLRVEPRTTFVPFHEVEQWCRSRDLSAAAIFIDLAEAEGGELDYARAALQILEQRKQATITWGLIAPHWVGCRAWILARALRLCRRDEEAFEAFELAWSEVERAGAPLHRAEVAARFAQELRVRARPEDLRRAEELERISRDLLAAFGLAERVPEPTTPISSSDPVGGRSQPEPTPSLSIHKEGESWRVEGGAEPFILGDTKGVRLLARLVAEPGREFHVLDLEGARAVGSDAGELLDERARASYGARIRDLREDIDEAERFGDYTRETRAREELAALEAELARAVGLGGRSRKAGSAAERARQNIQRRLRDALRRISAVDPALGRHVDRALKTGAYCVYDP